MASDWKSVRLVRRWVDIFCLFGVLIAFHQTDEARQHRQSMSPSPGALRTSKLQPTGSGSAGHESRHPHQSVEIPYTKPFGGELDSRARQACEEKVVVQSHVNNLPIIPDAELNRLDTLQQVVLE